MAKDERLNEEAARNNNTPPSATKGDIITLNQLNDQDKQLPELEERQDINEEKKKGYIESPDGLSGYTDEAYPKYS